MSGNICDFLMQVLNGAQREISPRAKHVQPAYLKRSYIQNTVCLGKF